MSIDRTRTLEEIRSRLQALEPSRIDIVDDSHRHAGHAGAREGGHFTLTIVAAAFLGLNPLQRQRKVLELLGDLRQIGIHALSIVAKAPCTTAPDS